MKKKKKKKKKSNTLQNYCKNNGESTYLQF